MKLKKSKLKSKHSKNIRDFVREEIQKSISRNRQIMSGESIKEYNKYYKTAKKKLMLDLLKPSVNVAIKQTFTRSIASQVIKSLMNKF